MVVNAFMQLYVIVVFYINKIYSLLGRTCHVNNKRGIFRQFYVLNIH